LKGERFYDLVRIASRRNDPSYLADKVSAKFSGAEKDAIHQKLMDEQNWYIHYFD
jgi:starch-binding outer membrane protein, SusD/RagB family